MAKKQYFLIKLDGAEHRVIYTRSAFSKTIRINIDGEEFELPRGAREEPFRLGDEQAMLSIAKNGKVSIRTRKGEAQEVTAETLNQA